MYLQKECLVVSTDDCHSVSIIIRKPEFLLKMGQSLGLVWHRDAVTPKYALCNILHHGFMYLSLSFSVSHPCAFPFLYLLIYSIFLSHSSAFLSSSYVSLFLPLCTLNWTEIAPFIAC